MDRCDFIEAVSGIQYPEMIVHFFDHFIALKQIVDDTGKIRVINNTDSQIVFSIDFSNKEDLNYALAIINTLGGTIVIYNRPMSVCVEVPADLQLQIKLG